MLRTVERIQSLKMKTTYILFLLTYLLINVAAAQPSKVKRHVHEHEYQKKDSVVVYKKIVKIPYPQATPADFSHSSSEIAEEQSYSSESDFRRAPAKAGWGFTYAPFKGDGNCKSAEDIKKDFSKIANEYTLVRIYGTSCNQVANVLAAAQKHNLKIFAGIFDIDQVEQEAKLIIDAAKKDWARFETISVGNEMVNSVPDNQKAAMAEKVVKAIGRAKSILKGAGFKGKIVTVDTLVAARAYPSICEASDFCAVNCHPFFDGNVAADGAGKFVLEQLRTLSRVIPSSMKIVVTETGWPWNGKPNKAAVPSLPNQEKALASIRKAFRSNKSGVILFTIYNDRWKKNNEAQFGAEQYWGIKGLNAPSG